MQSGKEFLGEFSKPLIRRLAQIEISHIDRVDVASKALANALTSALRRESTPDERRWVEAIETLRRELVASTDEIQFIDFGVGAPELKLTAEQMYEGSVKHTTVGEVCRRASKSPFWSHFLFRLIREVQPRVCLELGTCLGMSSCYQGAALKVNQRGTLVTMEGAESFAALARENVSRIGLDNVEVVTGRFQDTLSGVLDRCHPVDYAFIDGHHDEHATIAYFEQIAPFLSARAVVVFDDISWSRGMASAWRHLQAVPEVAISADLRSVGVCIVDPGVKKRQRYRVHLA
jgi:predicted O-methyltransferase YrrM